MTIPTARFLEIPVGSFGAFFFPPDGPLESRSRSPTLCGDPDIEPRSEILGVLRTGDPQNANGFNTKSWSAMDDWGHPLGLRKALNDWGKSL